MFTGFWNWHGSLLWSFLLSEIDGHEHLGVVVAAGVSALAAQTETEGRRK